MSRCEECNKVLGIFEGYRHPLLGKNKLLCSPCFDQVSESIKKWRKFVLSNSFNNVTSDNGLQLNWKNVITSAVKNMKTLGNVLVRKEV